MKISEKKNIKTVPFPKWPISSDREVELLTQVVRSGNWWRMTGDKIHEFETKFATLHKVKHCLAVTNGTHAIELVLAALGIGRGDEVIVPAFTFISTFTAPIYADVTPIPVDVDENTFCMTAEAFEKAITPRTKAVIPVHMAGHMCDMEAISKIAKKYDIKVIEDAAHAHGASYKDKHPGYFSDAAIFSFQNGKIMTCGEGGAVITNDQELYRQMYLLHGVGRPKDDKDYAHLVLGTNNRMSEFQASVLIAQLERLEEHNKIREGNAKKLDEILEQIQGIKHQNYSEHVTINTHYMYMFRFDRNYFGNLSRKQFVEELNAEGIPAFVAYPVVSETEFVNKQEFRGHIQHSYQQYHKSLKNAADIAENVVWLPHYTLLGEEQCLYRIRDAIIAVQRKV